VDRTDRRLECLLALGRTREARRAFARAYELLSRDPWFPPTETARLERIRRLAGEKPGPYTGISPHENRETPA